MAVASGFFRTNFHLVATPTLIAVCREHARWFIPGLQLLGSLSAIFHLELYWFARYH